MLDFKFLDKYDSDNHGIFVGRKKGTFHCTCCGNKVSHDGSYSNQGYNLVCYFCIKTVADNNDVSIGEVLEREVWNK